MTRTDRNNNIIIIIIIYIGIKESRRFDFTRGATQNQGMCMTYRPAWGWAAFETHMLLVTRWGGHASIFTNGQPAWGALVFTNPPHSMGGGGFVPVICTVHVHLSTIRDS